MVNVPRFLLLRASLVAEASRHRYDARLLLDASHILAKPSDPDRLSPTGWSDLPSDSEDTFFLSQEEIEDYHRDKRRRMIEHGREQRLKAMRAEDEEGIEAKEEDEWGGSDEEVPNCPPTTTSIV